MKFKIYFGDYDYSIMNRNRNRNKNSSAAIGSNNNNVKKNSRDGRDGRDDNYAKDGYTINVDNEGHANGDKDKMNKKDTDINHHHHHDDDHHVLDDVNHSNNDDDSNEKNDTAASSAAVVVDYDKLRELYFSKFQTIFRVHGGAMMKIKTGG